MVTDDVASWCFNLIWRRGFIYEEDLQGIIPIEIYGLPSRVCVIHACIPRLILIGLIQSWWSRSQKAEASDGWFPCGAADSTLVTRATSQATSVLTGSGFYDANIFTLTSGEPLQRFDGRYTDEVAVLMVHVESEKMSLIEVHATPYFWHNIELLPSRRTISTIIIVSDIWPFHTSINPNQQRLQSTQSWLFRHKDRDVASPAEFESQMRTHRQCACGEDDCGETDIAMLPCSRTTNSTTYVAEIQRLLISSIWESTSSESHTPQPK